MTTAKMPAGVTRAFSSGAAALVVALLAGQLAGAALVGVFMLFDISSASIGLYAFRGTNVLVAVVVLSVAGAVFWLLRRRRLRRAAR